MNRLYCSYHMNLHEITTTAPAQRLPFDHHAWTPRNFRLDPRHHLPCCCGVAASSLAVRSRHRRCREMPPTARLPSVHWWLVVAAMSSSLSLSSAAAAFRRHRRCRQMPPTARLPSSRCWLVVAASSFSFRRHWRCRQVPPTTSLPSARSWVVVAALPQPDRRRAGTSPLFRVPCCSTAALAVV